MIWLILIAVALTLATAWYVARPLARAAMSTSNEEFHQLGQRRDRLLASLTELDVEAADRNMDAAVVVDEKLRLEAELAEVLKRLETLTLAATVTAVPAANRQAWLVTLIFLALLLPFAGSGIYVLNHFEALRNISGSGPAPMATGPGGAPDPAQMVARLEQRLRENPNDAAGWARLGRSYAVLGQQTQSQGHGEYLEKAYAAFVRAERLAPQDPNILAEFAWFLFSMDPNNTEGEVAQIYDRLYKIAPDHTDALWFTGLAAFKKGDVRTAVARWEKLLKQIPPENPNRKNLEQAINQAKAKLPSK